MWIKKLSTFKRFLSGKKFCLLFVIWDENLNIVRRKNFLRNEITKTRLMRFSLKRIEKELFFILFKT